MSLEERLNSLLFNSIDLENKLARPVKAELGDELLVLFKQEIRKALEACVVEEMDYKCPDEGCEREIHFRWKDGWNAARQAQKEKIEDYIKNEL